jgi:hypothetical protein
MSVLMIVLLSVSYGLIAMSRHVRVLGKPQPAGSKKGLRQPEDRPDPRKARS